MTFARPYNLRISGSRSNEQNITVMRAFSNTWAADSLPLPVKFNQTTLESSITRKLSIPFGDTLTKPS